VSTSQVSETEARPQPGGAWVLLACLLLLVVSLAAAQLLASSGRDYRTGDQLVIEARGPRDAFSQLARSGVRGRVVVVLAERSRADERHDVLPVVRWPGAGDEAAPVNGYDYVTALIASGIAREVAIVLPDDEWTRVSGLLAQRPDIRPHDGRLLLRLHGTTVSFSRLIDLPARTEPVVVSVAAGMESRFDTSMLSRVTSPESADVVIRERSR